MRITTTIFVLILSHSMLLGQVSILPQIETSHIIGVSPMPIFLDGTASTINDSTVNTFHDLHYQWNFGDFFSGFWNNIPKSKNRASSPLAAHVFDSVGLHIIELEVFQNSKYSVTKPLTIKIQDANTFYKGEKTICFSKKGEFADAPDQALMVQINDFRDVEPYLSDSVRILFRRGDTISTDVGLDLSGLKYVTIGAFGPRLNINSLEMSENAPVIIMNGTMPLFQMSNSDSLCQSEHLKIIELNLINNQLESGASAIYAGGETKHHLLYRLSITNFSRAIFYDDEELEYHSYANKVKPFKEVFIADCIIKNENQPNDLIKISGENIAIIGNTLNNNRQEGNVLHMKWTKKSVVSNNCFLNPGERYSNLYISSPAIDYCATECSISDQIVISDNNFETEEGGNRMLCITKTKQEQKNIANVIINRNFFTAIGDRRIKNAVYVSGSYLTIKNNIINGSGASRYRFTGIHVDNPFDQTVISNINITNNTIFKQDWVDLMVGVKIGKWVAHSFVANNLIYSPAAMDLIIVHNQGIFTTAKRNIYPYVHPFIAEDPINAIDFQLDSVSLVLDNGVNHPVARRDFLEKERSSEERVDIGAFQFTSTPITTYNMNSIIASNLPSFPYPIYSYYTMDLSQFTSSYNVEIFNSEGNLIHSDNSMRDMFYTWKTKTHDNGIYWLKVSSKNATMMTKVKINR